MRYFLVFIITLLLLLVFYLDELYDLLPVSMNIMFPMSTSPEALLYREDKLGFYEAFTEVGAEAAVARGILFLYSPSIALTLNSSTSPSSGI